MQMMLERGLEHGVHQGLGWIKGEVVPIKFDPRGQQAEPLVAEGVRPIAEASRPEQGQTQKLKIPHMGWNELELKQPKHQLFCNLPPAPHAYFVHSYHAVCSDPADVIATVDYGGTLSACIAKGNMLGTQFHPEKSQAVGLQLIKNFLSI
jgi:glutamine amidotransferase